MYRLSLTHPEDIQAICHERLLTICCNHNLVLSDDSNDFAGLRKDVFLPGGGAGRTVSASCASLLCK